MDLALILSAALMGLAGTPHCLAMCGPACAALGVTGNARHRAWSFHLGRLVGYAVVGAVAAGGVSVLGVASAALPMLRPLWSLLHVAALGLGLWLLVTARQPAWVERLGRRRVASAATHGEVSVIAWRPVRRRAVPVADQPPGTRGGPCRAVGAASAASVGARVVSSFAAGSLWAAWPCGLLQSAIVVAALANGPASGAAVMAAFAIASGVGLAGGAALWLGGWRRGRGASSGPPPGRSQGGPAPSGGSERGGTGSAAWAVRAAGLMLALASAWALGHGLWMRAIDYCFG